METFKAFKTFEETFNTEVHLHNLKGDIEPNHPSEINSKPDQPVGREAMVAPGGMCITGLASLRQTLIDPLSSKSIPIKNINIIKRLNI